MKASPLLPLAPVLARQFGVVSVAQAAALGVPAWRLSERCGTGELERLYRGVYGSVLHADSADRRWMAAQLAGGDRVVISHLAAAHLHGLQYTGTKKRPALELSSPRGARRLPGPVTVHTQVPFRASDVVELGVWRVTSVPWTLASLAYRLGAAKLERAVGAALAGDAMTVEELAACIPRLRFCAGVQLLRDLLSRLSPELRLTRSQAERLVLRLVEKAGLPKPEVNHRVVDASGRVRELDLAWPEWGVCVEIDLHPSHEGTIGRHLDGRRQNDLVTAWTILRFDDLDLQFEPATVVDVIRRTLAHAGAPV